MLPSIFVSVFVFLFGVIIGSFLNVVILRYNTGFSLGGRSRCFSCGKTLSWYELLPLLSFIFQKGKCAGCKSKISWQYPIVEALTGFIFLATVHKFFPTFSSTSVSVFSLLEVCYYLSVFSLLIVIAAYDIKHKIIPNGLVYAFIALAFLKTLFLIVFQLSDSISSVLYFILSGPLLFLPFFLLWFLSQGKWMGFGDAKLALGIGWFLGVGGGFSSVFLAFYSGALVGLGIIAFQQFLRIRHRSSGLNLDPRNLTIKSEIPFGPFLILGVFLVFFLGIDFLSIFNL